MRITKYDTELQDDKLNNPEMISHMMCEIFRADRKAALSATATRAGRIASLQLV